ncbi:hypothetical protein QEF67_001113 [Klebsiella aerogenes]|uniref:glycosyl hydrolase n=1 Tax=Klebsiella aerogenes TaxID=548 RepID=UPI0005028041|nr:glycosyl hydrolase [Klebsiella aerogenes]EIV6644768.1 hypothetical protein [Klebsiella aerogenes]EKT3980594.1 hypothetical protein [Klebsiella aerogenes]ELA0148644.1 hypothetical protein [Klebsiella aerogenes]KGB05322.1 glycosyl hydrolase catalytic core family protein [Klebsiella aerogenes]KLE49879.1 hypothetical protein YA13_01620 [Klebsiella aerogenes]
MRAVNIILCIFLFISKCYAESMTVGVGVHPVTFNGPPDKLVELLKEYNIESIRTDYPWRNVEKEKNKFNPGNKKLESFIKTASTNGIKPVLILDYGNPLYEKMSAKNPQGKPTSDITIDAFVRYAEWTTEHFGKDVGVYEIWNEWIQGAGKLNKLEAVGEASALNYAKLVVRTCNAIKKIDKDKKIIIGSTSAAKPSEIRWLTTVLAHEGVLSCIDGISLHIYGFSVNQKLSPQKTILPVIVLQDYLKKKFMLKEELPFYITEIGVPSVSGASYNQMDIDNYFRYIIAEFRKLDYVKGIWWYDFIDDGNDKKNKEHNFGILTEEFNAKPIGDTIKDIKSKAN